MYNLNARQKKIVAIIGTIVLVLIILYFYNSRIETPKLEDDIILEENQVNSNISSKTEEKDLIIIHITGAVKMPGIVKLEEGARITYKPEGEFHWNAELATSYEKDSEDYNNADINLITSFVISCAVLTGTFCVTC